jgi:hypothetical protein
VDQKLADPNLTTSQFKHWQRRNWLVVGVIEHDLRIDILEEIMHKYDHID